jgi:hypothetical protein
MIKTFKTPRQFHLNNKKQKGAALILFFFMTLIIVSGVIVSHLNENKESVLQNRIFEDQHNARVLSEAKAALLGFATSYAETHLGQPVGYLPCPNTTNLNNVEDQRCAGIAGVGKAISGSSSLCADSCKGKGINVIGCFPWRTLGSPRLQDSKGNDLWYAVSGTYKNKQKQGLTSDTNGLFQIYDQNSNIKLGNSESDRAIAIVFIPNQEINGQARVNLDCSKPENYLDTFNGINNATGTKSGATTGNSGSENLPTALPSTFISSPKTNTFNDQMIWITPDDYIPIYEKMNQWVAKRVQHCLNLYVESNSGYVPWVADLVIDGSDLNYKDTKDKLFGRVPLDLSNTNASNSAMNNFWNTDTWLEETYNKIYNKPIKVADNCINDSPPCKCFENDLNDNDGYWGKWWNEWKEMVFIAVNKQFVPNSTDIADNTKNDNLMLDDIPAKFVVFIGGRKLANQSRNILSYKADYSSYLENSGYPMSIANDNINIFKELSTSKSLYFNKKLNQENNDFAICTEYP